MSISDQLNFFEKITIKTLKLGPIPNHVAFIMDGNRRFATKNNISVSEGHKEGSQTLAKILSWCLYMCIKNVTVFALSVENFKRSKSELENLMQLIKYKFEQLYEQREFLLKHSIRVVFIGDSSLIPKNIMKVINRCTELTRDNDKFNFNIAIAYSTLHELAGVIDMLSDTDLVKNNKKDELDDNKKVNSTGHLDNYASKLLIENQIGANHSKDGLEQESLKAINVTITGDYLESVKNEQIKDSTDQNYISINKLPVNFKNANKFDIINLNNQSIDSNMMFLKNRFETETSKQFDLRKHLLLDQPVDLMVRTGGDYRLSDFLLIQSQYAKIQFLKLYWPELNFLNFVKIIIKYQQHVYSCPTQ